MLKRLFYKITRGRPMVLVVERYFTDSVSGRAVNVYRDKFHRYWMANDRWGWFRVKKDPVDADEVSFWEEYNEVFPN